jgi:hypothetical protein
MFRPMMTPCRCACWAVGGWSASVWLNGEGVAVGQLQLPQDVVVQVLRLGQCLEAEGVGGHPGRRQRPRDAAGGQCQPVPGHRTDGAVVGHDLRRQVGRLRGQERLEGEGGEEAGESPAHHEDGGMLQGASPATGRRARGDGPMC